MASEAWANGTGWVGLEVEIYGIFFSFMESFVFKKQVLLRVVLHSDFILLGSLPQGRARGQNLVLYENSKSSSQGYMCLSGHR